MVHRILFLISLAILVCACASQVAVPPSSTNSNNLSWTEHAHHVDSLNQWSLRGRLNIRSTQGSDTVTFNWAQEGDEFTINLSGTLGLGAVKIVGNQQQVIIEKGGQPPIIANSLEEVSSIHLGFEFPASNLFYWIRGIPAPEPEAQSQVLENNLLTSLRQSDRQRRIWQLSYDRYQDINTLAMPGRIKIEHLDYRLIVLINRWQLDSV